LLYFDFCYNFHRGKIPPIGGILLRWSYARGAGFTSGMYFYKIYI